MATTTNFGWTTPDDTDLVKDGAAAIRTLGSAIDTTTKNLNPETTTGDISYRSATANTNTRLAIGTAGQVLTVNSGATAPEWATAVSSGLTLISTTSFSNVATQSFDNVFTSTYTNYTIMLSGLYLSTSSSDFRMRLRASGTDTTGAAYIVSGWKSTNVSLTNNVLQTTYFALGDIGTRDEQSLVMDILRPQVAKDTTGRFTYNGTNFNNPNGFGGQFSFAGTTSFDGFTLYAGANNIYGTVSIYGWSK